jgi:hypothetical protein
MNPLQASELIRIQIEQMHREADQARLIRAARAARDAGAPRRWMPRDWRARLQGRVREAEPDVRGAERGVRGAAPEVQWAEPEVQWAEPGGQRLSEEPTPRSSRAAWAAASLATGTRKGEQDT